MTTTAAASVTGSTGRQEALERAALWGLLASLLGREPTPDLLRALTVPEVREMLADFGLPADAPLDAEDLAVEYTRLFLGPGPHISLYASVHLGGPNPSLMGKPAAEMKRILATAGVMAEGEHAAIPDHLAVALDVMRLLTLRGADETVGIVQVQRRVLALLVPWLAAMRGALETGRPHPLYKGAIELALGFAESELAAMNT